MASKHQSIKASRHRGIEASRHRGVEAVRNQTDSLAVSHSPCTHSRAFSLIEVLLAIFILGIGVISIAALFPAGIAQQRQSVDDILGSSIANNALSLLRTKVRQEDFGYFMSTGIGPAPGIDPVIATISGDWTWRRPGFFVEDDSFPGSPVINVPAGSIDIFAQLDDQNFRGTDSEIPWRGNLAPDTGGAFFNDTAPHIIITQRERYYPQSTDASVIADAPKPQYVWDCMFRRYQGKILVAIFVYRVSLPGGGPATYAVPENQTNPGVAPLPIALSLRDPDPTFEPWLSTYGSASKPIDGLPQGVMYNADDATHAWQEPRQWILDQNNNIHRVVGNYRDSLNAKMFVELVRPVSPPAATPVNFPGPASPVAGAVTDIWYIPLSLQYDSDGNGTINANDDNWLLTPIYATVKEL